MEDINCIVLSKVDKNETLDSPEQRISREKGQSCYMSFRNEQGEEIIENEIEERLNKIT